MVMMMEENKDIFLAGSDTVFGHTTAQKNIPQYLFGAIHVVSAYLWTDFSTPPFPCKHMYQFRVTFSAVVLFQKKNLNTIAHTY